MNLIVKEDTFILDSPRETYEKEEPFIIYNDDTANWYLGKLANLEAEKHRVKAQSEKMLTEIERNIEHLQFLFGHQLEEYVRANLKGKSKTLHLLQGSVQLRKVPRSISLTDRDLALLEAYKIKEQGWSEELIPLKVVESLDTMKYRVLAEQILKNTGEILPGIEVVPEHESMSVKFGKEER
jgi:phage host-nuclease inhibitor protein Gam